MGAYIGSPSPYGTFDQGGNVWELLEENTIQGGSWQDPASYFSARSFFVGGGESELIGFRIVRTLLEPDGTLAAAAVIAGLGVLRVVARPLFEKQTVRMPARQLD